MIRLILRLLGIRDYEVCQSCETLKQQLAFERDEKKQLTDTLLRIINPKVIVESEPVELNPVISTSGMFGRRRAALEERDRQEAKILKEKKFMAEPDDKLKAINNLEQELGIQEEA